MAFEDEHPKVTGFQTRGGNATPLPAPLPEPGSVMIWFETLL